MGWHKMDKVFMRLAWDVAAVSNCNRLNVGCVITDIDRMRVLSIGYNGNYKGGPNICDSKVPGQCGCLHAEDNACLKLDFTEPTKVAYVTHSPCVLCAKRLINAGIHGIFYDEAYRKQDGLDLLVKGNVQVEQLTIKGT